MQSSPRPAAATTARGVGAARRWFRVLTILSVLLPAMLFTAAALYDRAAIDRQAQRRVATTTDALNEHAQKVLETAQLALRLIDDRVRDLAWDDIRSDLGAHDYLARLVGQLPQLESAFLVDPAGIIAASSRAFPMPPFDVHNRDYVGAANGDDAGLFISAPFSGAMAGTTAFTVSQPRAARPTAPRGIVAVTVSPTYFANFYATMSDRSADSLALLARRDGTILVANPAAPDRTATLAADTTIMQALTHGRTRGEFSNATGSGGAGRIAAFRTLESFPVIAAYSISRNSVLAEWYAHLAPLGVFALALGATIYLASRRAMISAEREKATLNRLLEETQRREQAEEALRQVQKIEALGRLTGGVAHDFNNLLTAILGALEVALKRVGDQPALHKLLSGAMQSAQRGAKLTAQMLAFSRRQELSVAPMDVNAALGGMGDLLRRSLGPRIDLRYSLAQHVWTALGDSTQLELAVLNLAINARDAMPDGGTLRVATENRDRAAPRPEDLSEGDYVCITVADTGGGMPPEVANRAFEPFFTTKDVGQGTGLGLSMVHGFARQAGGTAAIESAPAKGTTVRIYLPRAGSHTQPGEPVALPGAATPPLPVMLVDDDEAVRTMTAEMLADLGHAVTEAPDGTSALHLLRTAPPPAILVLDYAMPGLTGTEVARLATDLVPGLPILFVSGYADHDALKPWLARGYRLLPKPFTMTALAAGIEAARQSPVSA